MKPIEAFGNIDIYLFDQILKGRFDGRRAILDAGCGGGRNIVWFLRQGFDVYGVDRDENAVENCRALASALGKASDGRFKTSDVASLPFDDESFDVVISSAVLHFASDEDEFAAMVREMWRVLKPEGILFARLASDIGIEKLVEPRGGRRFALPDGSERFLVDHDVLLKLTRELGGALVEPIKTTNVQNLRAMTTWIVEKSDQERGS